MTRLEKDQELSALRFTRDSLKAAHDSRRGLDALDRQQIRQMIHRIDDKRYTITGETK